MGLSVFSIIGSIRNVSGFLGRLDRYRLSTRIRAYHHSVRCPLGEEAFEAAVAKGLNMTLEQAIAFALTDHQGGQIYEDTISR
jgi:hypothetical protein